jgi:hypothetical protein
MQAQLAGAVAKAELEASQKLLSVLPFQTGQPNRSAARHNMDRHSFALGDTEEYDRLFSSRMPTTSNDFLAPRSSQQYLMEDNLMPPSRLSNRTSLLNRPKSVIEGDLSSIFSRDWSYGNAGGLVSSGQERAPGRPKSADITNWSFAMTSSVSSKSLRDKEKMVSSPWTLSPTVSTFEKNDLSSANWLNSNNNSNSSRTVLLNEDAKSFRRRPNGNRIPGTVPETDEKPTNIVLSMYDEEKPPVFGSEGYSSYLMSNSRPASRSTSPAPSQSNSKSLFNRGSLPPKSPRMTNGHYGQFLNPNDNRIEEGGYYSDHSDASNRSGASRGKKKNYGHSHPKEKKNNEGVDMQLLEGKIT